MTTLKRTTWAVIAVLVACGCGSSNNNGTTDVTGTIAGTPFEFQNALSVVWQDDNGSELDVVLTKQTTCDDLPFDLAANDQIVLLALTENTPPFAFSAPTATGTFAVGDDGSGGAAVITFTTTNSQCASTEIDDALTAGTVTLTALSSGSVSGSVNATTGSNALSGTFTTSNCAAMQPVFLSSSCM